MMAEVRMTSDDESFGFDDTERDETSDRPTPKPRQHLKTPLIEFGELTDDTDLLQAFHTRPTSKEEPTWKRLRAEFELIFRHDVLREFKPKVVGREKSVFQAYLSSSKTRDLINYYKTRSNKGEDDALDRHKHDILRGFNDALCAAPWGSRMFADIMLYRATFLKDVGNFKDALADLDRIEDVCSPIVQEEENEDLVVRMKTLRNDCERSQQATEDAEVHVPKLIRELMHDSTRTDDVASNKDSGEWRPVAQVAAGGSEDPTLVRRSDDEFIVAGRERTDALRMEYSEKTGNRFVAQTLIRPGEIVASEEPVCSTLFPDNWGLRCTNCHKVVWIGIPCSGCSYAIFCNEECQAKADAFHKYECPVMGNLVEVSQHQSAFLAYRLATRINADDVCKLRTTETSSSSSKDPRHHQSFSRDDDARLEEGCFDLNKRENEDGNNAWNAWKATFNYLHHRNDLNTEEALEKGKLAVYLVKLLEVAGYFDASPLIGEDEKALTIDPELNEETEHETQSEVLPIKSRKEPTGARATNDDAMLTVGELLYNWLLSFPPNSFTTSEIRARKHNEKDETDEQEKHKWKGCRMKVLSPSVGEAVYNKATMFNHSCYPNASQYFTDCSKIVIRAHRAIQPGEEVTISYGVYAFCDEEDERRSWLAERYHFDCECAACAGRWGRMGVSTDLPVTTSSSISSFSSSLISRSPLMASSAASLTTVNNVARRGGENDDDAVGAGEVSGKTSVRHGCAPPGDETPKVAVRKKAFSTFDGHSCEICGPYPEHVALRLTAFNHPSSWAATLTSAARWVEEMEKRYSDAVDAADHVLTSGQESSTAVVKAMRLRQQPPVCLFQAQFFLVHCFLLSALFSNVYPVRRDDDEKRQAGTTSGELLTKVRDAEGSPVADAEPSSPSANEEVVAADRCSDVGPVVCDEQLKTAEETTC